MNLQNEFMVIIKGLRLSSLSSVTYLKNNVLCAAGKTVMEKGSRKGVRMDDTISYWKRNKTFNELADIAITLLDACKMTRSYFKKTRLEPLRDGKLIMRDLEDAIKKAGKE